VGKSRRRIQLLLLLALVVLPATVALAAPSQKDISRAIYAAVKPPDAGRQSHVIFWANPNEDTNRNGRIPRSIEFRFARGFNIGRGAIPASCDSGKAQAFSCRSDSQIGSASLVAAVQNGARQASGKLKLYLGTAKRATHGPVAANVRAGGQRRATTGRLVHIHDWVYSYSLRIDGLDKATGGRLERIRADIGSTRKVERNGHVKRVSLITNPKICSGGWHYEVAITYTDGTRHWGDGVASCTEN